MRTAARPPAARPLAARSLAARSLVAVPVLFVVAVAASCGAPSDRPSPCDRFEVGDACVTQEAVDECLAAAAQCGDDVAVLESCPVQFACG